MHMSDALINPAVAGTMFVLSAAAAGVSIKKIHRESADSQQSVAKKIPLTGVMSAFVFAAQMLNFTIPGTGSSGHLCGGMLLSVLLGPWCGFISMISVLLIQALFFADGGLLALGCNVWNMAFYGCFVGSFIIWKPMISTRVSKARIMAASIIACVLTLQMGAFSVTLETLISGIAELPFKFFVAAMQPIHLAIGAVEGLITGAVLCFIYETRSELLWGVNSSKKTRMTLASVLVVLAICAVVMGGGISLLASEHPDGLEWSMEKIAGTSEFESESLVLKKAADIQDMTSVMPDYNLGKEETVAGKSASGLFGSLIVFAFTAGVAMIIRNKNKKVE
ncbi:energy-coupling factor ABC transporter permease [Treponema sp.]|uniref:energy-coupling factor ABC transporter permease n=1 Tax=Treponema sp. TaxID=166 RepID=UPI00298D9FBB|nr:energy-coupling factor ABC transporter permease [Treponema sp.]MCQ2240155.1 energy-coupling factor ABC transporter permease [Treponema sp.]